MRRLGATLGRRADRRAAQARAQRRAEAVRRRPGDRVPAPDRSTPTRRNAFAYLELERLLRTNARWYDLVEVLGQARRRGGGRPGASRRSWRCAWRSPTSGRRSWTRPTAPPRRWRRCWRWRRRTCRRCCRWPACTRAPSAGTRRARRWRRRPRTRRRRRGDRRDPLPQRADPDPRRKPTRRRSSGRCCARWTPTRRTGRRWRRWRSWRARRRTTSGWCSCWSCALRGDDATTTSASALLTEIAALYTGPLGQPRGGAAAPRAAGGAGTRRRSAGREHLADALVARRPHRRRGAASCASWSTADQGAPGQGRGALAQRLGTLAEARGDLKGAAEQLRRGLQAGPRATPRRWRRSAAWPSRRRPREGAQATTARCCCRTSTRRRPASRRRRST